MNFHETNAQVLKHLCTCCDCREALYQHRETARTEYLHEQSEQECSVCKQLSTSDIFDYVVTYGLVPSDERSLRFQDSITSHLRECPAALAKIQELHQSIYEIAERAESEVITIYHIDEFAKTKDLGESEDLYAGFPISVEIAHRNDKMDIKEPAQSTKFSIGLKRKILDIRGNHIFKTGIVAVAVVLFGVAFFFRSSVAGALTMAQIYTAIDQVRNVRISTYTGQSIPIQEKWISRSFNVLIIKTGEDSTLLDFANNQRRAKISGMDSAQITQLSNDIMADIKDQTSGSLGLMPYNRISEIPPDAEWSRVADDEPETSINNTEIYELKWIEKDYTSPPIFKKWQFTIDSETNLPHRIEVYRKSYPDNTYTLKSTTEVEYLDDLAMQAVIERL